MATVKQVIPIQSVKNIMVLASDCNPDIMPKSFYVVNTFKFKDILNFTVTLIKVVAIITF